MVEGNLCFKLKFNATQYKIKPGVNNGIKIILNAETFDNGNPGTSFKGFRILVVDTEEGPPGNLMDMYGTSISTGSALKMSITSKIFKTRKPGALRAPTFLGPCGAGTLASRAGGLRPPEISGPHLSPHLARMTPVYLLTFQNDPPQSPHLARMTPLYLLTWPE